MIASPKNIVLDSNLIVSAFLNPEGIAATAIDIADSNFDIVCTTETIGELVDVLSRDKFDKYVSKEDRAQRIREYAQAVCIVDVALQVTDCKDPKDNKFLALALATQAALIVSGDKRDLLIMNPYKGSPVIGIRDFVENYKKYL